MLKTAEVNNSIFKESLCQKLYFLPMAFTSYACRLLSFYKSFLNSFEVCFIKLFCIFCKSLLAFACQIMCRWLGIPIDIGTKPLMVTLPSVTRKFRASTIIFLYLSSFNKCFHSWIVAVKNCGYSCAYPCFIYWK